MRSLPVLIALLWTQFAWGNIDRSLEEIESLIRLRDYSQAVQRLRPLAEQGIAEAQYRLAGLYRVGKGVDRDLDRARSLYLEAAQAGNANAQYSYALLVEKSKGDNSREQALVWYRRAAEQGHEAARKQLARTPPAEKTNARELSQEEIFNAVRHNDRELIDSWVDSGGKLNQIDEQGNTIVMAALIAGWPDLAETLIHQTRLHDKANKLGDYPLHIAAVRDYREVAVAVLVAGTDIDRRDARGNTALMLAIKNENLDLAGFLLDSGANPDARNQKLQSPSDLAFAPGNSRSKVLFASRGLKPKQKPNPESKSVNGIARFSESVRKQGNRYNGWPLVSVAIELGETRIAKQLIAQRREIDSSGPGANRALHVAARNLDHVNMKRLLAQRVEVNAVNRKNQTALYLASEANCLDCVKLLLAGQADPSIAASGGVTPLEIAVQNGASRVAAALLATNASYPGIHRVLSLAVEKRMQVLSKLLITRDPDLAKLDDKRRSILWHSADKGLTETVGRLLATGRFDVNQVDAGGYSALAQAVTGGHLKIVRMLIEAGADPRGQTGEGNSMLMLAVLSKKADLVEYMLRHEPDINRRNDIGDTALMIAAGDGQLRIVEKLMDAGADLRMRNNEEMNAVQIAKNAGHEQTAKTIYDRSNLVFKLFN